MSFWYTLIYWVIVTAITIALTPKPEFENAKPSRLGDFKFPKTEEGSPVALWWGRLRMRAPNVLWYGDLKAEPIYKKMKTGIFSSKVVVVGHEYFLGLQLAIGIPTGGTTTLRKIWFDEKLAWEGSVSVDGTAINIDEPSLFGGRENGGGVVGTVRFYTGSFTQNINTYLQGVISDSTILPAYRGICYAVFEHVNLGESPNIKKISFEVETIPDQLTLGAVGFEGDANPAEVAYDILRSEWGRLGIKSASIDSTSFAAAGSQLETELHGIALSVQSSNTGGDILEEILKQVDGIVYEDPPTKQIKMLLIRDDYDVDTIPLFDETNIIEVVEWGKSTWLETVNQLRVLFNARSDNYNSRPAMAQDMANISFQGKVRTSLVNYPGVSNAVLANQLAARDLSTLSIPLAKMTIAVNRNSSTLLPGEAVKVSWPDYGLSQIVMRVLRYDLGELDDGRILLYLVQDRFSVKDTIYADPPDTNFVTPIVAATAATIRNISETPRWLNLRGVTATLATDADLSHVLHLAVQPTALETFFEAQVSEDAGVTYGVDIDDASFADSALVHTAYAQNKAPYDTVTGLRIKSMTDSSILGSATAADIRSDGANLILVGTELMSFEGFTDNLDGTFTLNNVWRGLLDTDSELHAVDERVWFLSDIGLEVFGEGEYDGDEVLKARAITKTGFNTLAEGDATIDNLTLNVRGQRPYVPSSVTVGATAYPVSLVGQNQTVAWNRRDRLSSAIARGDDADETPETNVEYVIEWTLNGGGLNTQIMGTGTSFAVDFLGTGTIVAEVYSRFTGPGLESYDRWGWTFTIT